MDPVTIITVGKGLALKIAGKILAHHAKKLNKTALGSKLRKIGLLDAQFEDNLRTAIAEAVTSYFVTHPSHRMNGVISFLSHPTTTAEISGYLLNGSPLDVGAMCGRLRDDLDVPKNLSFNLWPNGINPESFIAEFLRHIAESLAKDADRGVMWLSLQIAQLNSSLLNIREQLAIVRFEGNYGASNSALTTQWAAFERSYLSHLKHRASRLSTPGARDLHGINQSLSVAYIALSVKAGEKSAPVRAEQFLVENPLIVIRGPAGSGKTTLLNWIIWNCGSIGEPTGPWHSVIPFFVPLRKVALIETGAPQAKHFVKYSVEEEIWLQPTPDGWLTDILYNQQRAIIMIDGVDELPPTRRPAFWDWLRKLAEDYPGNRIVVTSRLLPVSTEQSGAKRSGQWDPPVGFVEAHLEEMSSSDIASFIAHWHDAVDLTKLDELEQRTLKQARDTLPQKLEDPANRRIRELCSTPLLCAMVCVLHWREEGYLPRQRVDLYERCCDMLIDARDVKRGISPPSGPLSNLTTNDKHMILQRLAFDMLRNQPDGDETSNTTYRIEIPRGRALQWIRPRILSFQHAGARECSAESVLDYLIERTGLLREPSAGLVDFPHRTFQEYLAACAAGAESQENFLARQADDDQWHETIMLAAGTTTGGVAFGRALIQALIKRAERHKSNRRRSMRTRKTCYALALGCLENLRQQEPSLRDEVLSHLQELVPPRNEGDARILSVAGDAAMPHLEYSKWKSQSADTVAACAQALRLIGTARARKAVDDGYIADERALVAAEVSRIASIPYTSIPYVARHVQHEHELPGFAKVDDIARLVGLEGLTDVWLPSTLPRNTHRLSELNNLKTVSFDGTALSEISAVHFPQSVEKLQLIRCKGSDLGWLKHAATVKSLVLAGGQVTDLSQVGELLPDLESLVVIDLGIKNASAIGNLQSLTYLRVDSCNSLHDLSAISDLRKLRSVIIDDCRKVTDIAWISKLTEIRRLEVVGSPDVQDPSAIGNLTNLDSLWISNCRAIRTLDFLAPLKNLERLSLVALPALRDVTTISALPILRTLWLRACPIEKTPVLLANSLLENVELFRLDHLGSLDFLKRLNSVVSLAIENCPLIESLSPISQMSHITNLVLKGLDKLTDLSSLASFQDLKNLQISNCPGIQDLTTLSGLIELERVALSDCKRVSDLSPLSLLPKLSTLSVLDCAVSDMSGLENASQLENIIVSKEQETKIHIPESHASKVRYVQRHTSGHHFWRRSSRFYDFNADRFSGAPRHVFFGGETFVILDKMELQMELM